MAAQELQLRPGGEFLAHLECGPGGYGHASALEFADRLRRRAEGGALVLLVLGEPLSGKSTFVENLLRWLIGPPDHASPELQFKLIRWGDAMRAQRHLGLLRLTACRAISRRRNSRACRVLWASKSTPR